ncbi:uncharacterized protein LOC113866979 [Abrus precatorius]|uniref:Uncharacterized protein LOC113866979 n=1 Tax=Abrus precatorius TaxID=3816 RepID=A0A8B8LS07_ABRPR|nr:uncharacterized protein LOC113866979 [Abrus precatorius]XP_027357647.1 uncharacterized protein LOC113866979 [Abrus precatorius]XP_027357648.1 uncharacterized protein LOC113866979 [Abrus precatorius]XP_027357649.1 uncharacterized protein LOC113866979 [Abrus precatorius]
MALSWRPFTLTRITDLSLYPLHPPKPPPPPSLFLLTRRRSFLVSCLVDGFSDDVVSTRKSSFDRGFTVIANMLRRIEPLDNSVISKGVSHSARDSMKQTISTMLGLLPSDHFSVTVTVSKHPLHRLLFSSIITGYTLWNAEYRMSLMRNLDISSSEAEGLDCETTSEVLEVKSGGEGDEKIEVVSNLESCSSSPRVFGDLPPQALNYIQQLQSELTSVKEELNAQKQEMLQLEYDRGNRNNLLEYLRSLDPAMVTELSRPSSVEVEDIIHQLVQNILRRFFVDDASSSFMEQSVEGNIDNQLDSGDEFSDKVATSRDYLAKLLFWCMLLGHHLRGLENRLHLSCVVGLL